MREHCILFKYLLGLGSTLMYINYSNSITSRELQESHSPLDTCCWLRRTVTTTDIVVFAQKNVTVLIQGSTQANTSISTQFSSSHSSLALTAFLKCKLRRHADSEKRGLLKMQFELNKLIIHHGSGGGERETFSCLIKTSEAHSGRTSLICTKSWD